MTTEEELGPWEQERRDKVAMDYVDVGGVRRVSIHEDGYEHNPDMDGEIHENEEGENVLLPWAEYQAMVDVCEAAKEAAVNYCISTHPRFRRYMDAQIEAVMALDALRKVRGGSDD